jgi:hypothetical protein
MNSATQSVSVHDALPSLPGYRQSIFELRKAGAEQVDPVCLHYLEALAARADEQKGRVKMLLSEKLAKATAELSDRIAKVGEKAGRLDVAHSPAVQPGTLLAELTRYLVEHTHEATQQPQTSQIGMRSELKAVRQFRSTWSKLSADKQLNHELDQAPKNAGPINSHMLVLRSLALMREISPDYLNRFISYADTLVYLDAIENQKPSRVKSVAKMPNRIGAVAVTKPPKVQRLSPRGT